MSEKTIRIRRATHSEENPYFQHSRATSQDRDLSYEALGMLTYLLSKPSDWVVQPRDLQRAKAGRDKVYGILNELIERCYIIREYTREKGVITGVDYMVFERPYTISTPFPEKPYTASPDTANPDITEYRESQNTESPPNGDKPASKEKPKTKTYADRAAAGKLNKADSIVRALAIHLFKAADNPTSITTKEGRIKRLLFGYTEAGWVGLFEYEKQHCPDSGKLYDHIVALVPGYVEYCLEGCNEIVISQDIFGDWWDRYRQANARHADPLDEEVDDPERPGVRITRKQLQAREAQRRMFERSQR